MNIAIKPLLQTQLNEKDKETVIDVARIENCYQDFDYRKEESELLIEQMQLVNHAGT